MQTSRIRCCPNFSHSVCPTLCDVSIQSYDYVCFFFFTPVPETGCPMWHAGLTLTLTFLVAVSFSAQARQRSFFRPQILRVNCPVRHVSCMLAKPLSSGTLVLIKTALYHWTLMGFERGEEKTRPEPSEFDFCAPPDFIVPC